MKTLSEKREKMPDNATDRPLVTFALFAYNQENYIREAVEGAFTQTYEPLEIILSDDCSSDRTFEIMKEMAAEYEGPHEVRLNQNRPNLGTALHVQNVANLTSGELFVVAAGDDISCPQRVEKIVDAWIADERKAIGLHSQARLKYGESDVSDEIAMPRCKTTDSVNLEWYLRNERNPLLSPTAAYTRELFSEFPPLLGGSIIEDGPLVIRGFLMGHFLDIQEPLVILRKLQESAGTGYTCQNLVRWNRLIRSKIISGFNKLQDISYSQAALSQKNLLEVRTRHDIRGLSRCIFSEAAAGHIWGKLRMGVYLALYYPASLRPWHPSTWELKSRVGFALNFTGLFVKKIKRKSR